MGRMLRKHGRRMLVVLAPVVLVWLHVCQVVALPGLHLLENEIHDTRLRWTMPRTRFEDVVIVDVDEQSLARVGRWPWGRDRVAAVVDELFERQQIELLGFDMVFAEPDTSSGLGRLQELAAGPLRGEAGFLRALDGLAPTLDHDAQLARALQNRKVVLGYYLTQDGGGRVSGALPSPVAALESLSGRSADVKTYTGFGGNLPQLVQSAAAGGFFNPGHDSDGVVRRFHLLSAFDGQLYESLAFSMFRMMLGQPAVEVVFSPALGLGRDGQQASAVRLRAGDRHLDFPVDLNLSVLVPFRGPGGPQGGSFRYVSASDVIEQKLAPGELKGKVVLFGTSAPGLLDLRTTPVGTGYPGVEVHANLLYGFLIDALPVVPDFAFGFELVQVTLCGLLMALVLPMLPAMWAVLVSAGVLVLVVGANVWAYVQAYLAFPLASSIALIGSAFALNMSYGYFFESRSKRELAKIFRTYVPPELVQVMVLEPDRYSMKAINRELTVMFSDMRGFTKLAETMEPLVLQSLLNQLFDRLSADIRAQQGTIDKYMGDCVMAFWGAPVESKTHPVQAVAAARAMVRSVADINALHRSQGLPEIGVGLGLHTDTVCVGDMGSSIRRSYTVIGDGVNLASRLEGLSRVYGVDLVASAATQSQVPGVQWRDLDLVRVKGKQQAVAIFTLWPDAGVAPDTEVLWNQALQAYRAQQWDVAEQALLAFEARQGSDGPSAWLHDQIAVRRARGIDPAWDGTTTFDTK